MLSHPRYWTSASRVGSPSGDEKRLINPTPPPRSPPFVQKSHRRPIPLFILISTSTIPKYNGGQKAADAGNEALLLFADKPVIYYLFHVTGGRSDGSTLRVGYFEDNIAGQESEYWTSAFHLKDECFMFEF